MGPIRRYMSMYFPNGTGPYWVPPVAGAGTAWALSPILEPLLPSKQYALVLGGVGNYSAYGNAHAEPSHGTNCGPAFHCYESRIGKGPTDAAPGGGISVDQVIAQQIGSLTALPSLQVGLSTIDSSCDGSPCAHARSMSWSGPNKPMYKTINPQAVFDQLVTAGAPMQGQSVTPTNPMMPSAALDQTRLLKKSILDAVQQNAMTLQPKLSTSDRARVDQYLTSVRDLEKLVAAPAMQVSGGGPTTGCAGMPRPPEPYADMNTPPDYSRETHMNLMIQLVTMAFACDITRTVTFMMDDSRSEFVYGHVPKRAFANPTSGTMQAPYTLSSVKPTTNGGGPCGNYHGAQHGDPEEFSSIIWWMALKVNTMVQALAGIKEGAGTVMDDTVIHFSSGMNGGNHDGLNIPTVLLGSGGGVLKQNAFMTLTGDAPPSGARLANLHLTLIQKVFGSSVASFGNTTSPASTGIVPQILA
jgi:hypothetical protein